MKHLLKHILTPATFIGVTLGITWLLPTWLTLGIIILQLWIIIILIPFITGIDNNTDTNIQPETTDENKEETH